jgi:hypothetical protein
MKARSETKPSNRYGHTEQQLLLLRACVFRGKRAIVAWNEWKSTVDMDRVDPGSQKLLPLLYHNLRHFDLQAPEMHTARGMYRFTWYQNQMLFRAAATLIKSFRLAGIQTMISGRAALAALHNKNYGIRPMDNVGVLVPLEDINRAIKVLSDLSWVSTASSLPLEFMNRYCAGSFCHPFRNRSGQKIDLRCHLIPGHRDCEADNEFRENAVIVNIQGISVPAVNPTDQLMRICAKLVMADRGCSLGWVTDAMLILNGSEFVIDWDRLVPFAEKRHLLMILREPLVYLHGVFDAPIPRRILQGLENKPVSIRERIEYFFISHRGLMGRPATIWKRFFQRISCGMTER